MRAMRPQLCVWISPSIVAPGDLSRRRSSRPDQTAVSDLQGLGRDALRLTDQSPDHPVERSVFCGTGEPRPLFQCLESSFRAAECVPHHQELLLIGQSPKRHAPHVALFLSWNVSRFQQDEDCSRAGIAQL
jgi:hypothetical protein